MSAGWTVLFHVLLSITYSQGRKGIGGIDQDWGYITVRPNAHMFWWLYYTTYNNVSNYTDRPLIIWLQGGPGMPSSGYGNFVEIGAQNTSFGKREGSFVERYNVLFVDNRGPGMPSSGYGNFVEIGAQNTSFGKREGSFVERYNVLFVDNPIGVGYSYISDNETQLVKNGDEIGEDLYNFFKVFITTDHPEFRKVPLYIFGESYGGKMATEFVYNLKQKEKNGNEKLCNLKGLALGDAYISPVDYLNHYAPLALNLGLVDKRGFTRIDELAKQIQVLINKQEFKKAADIENMITDLLSFETFGFDMNNFLAKTNSSRIPKVWDYMNSLEKVMNNDVKCALNITANITWEFFEDDLYDSLKGDLIKSVTHKVEELLNTTDIKIIVYNGILDFLVNTAGTISWLDSLNWKGKERWYDASQSALVMDEVSEGYSKRVDNLVFYAILRAGHSVPLDNLAVMNEILRLELVD